MPTTALEAHGIAIISDPKLASVALLRISAPYEVLHPTFFFGSRQHEGDLDFKAGNPDLLALQSLTRELRTVIVAHLDRPAIVTEFASQADNLLIEFGADDEAIIDVLTGKAACTGVLPLSLPRSMTAVRQRRWDVPNDDLNPLFPLGFRVR
jgi:beta-glucosidase